MKKTKKNKKKPVNLKRNLIAIIVVDFVLIGIISAGIYLIPGQAETISQTRSELMAQRISSQNYQKTTADLKAVEDDFEIIKNSLPDAESIVNFIELINTIDESANLKVFTFNADLPLEDNQGNDYLPLTLVIEDSLSQVIKSLNLLEQSAYLFHPVQFKASGPSLKSESVKTVFDLLIYVDSDFEKNNED